MQQYVHLQTKHGSNTHLLIYFQLLFAYSLIFDDILSQLHSIQVNPNCSNITVVELKNSVKNYILEVHNDLRDKLASGSVGNYPPASRMLEMVKEFITIF